MILDEVANQQVVGQDGKIAAADSRLDAMVIHTDEEAIIARETYRIVGG